MKPELRKWLQVKKATPTEVTIYFYARQVCRGNKPVFQNGDILKLHGTSRTNIRQNLVRMIKKGMLKKVSYQGYEVIIP